MRRVGTVDRTAQGMAVTRSPDATFPDIGTTIVDERLDTVGRVVDVIGPTDRPYIVIKPADHTTAAALLGRKLYVR